MAIANRVSAAKMIRISQGKQFDTQFEFQEYAGRMGFPPSRSSETDVKDFLEPIHGPEGAPNFLLMLFDDVGFGALMPKRPGQR